MDEKKKNRVLYAKIIIIQLVLQLAIFPIMVLIENSPLFEYDSYRHVTFREIYDIITIAIYLSPFFILTIISMLIPRFVVYKLKRKMDDTPYVNLIILPIVTTIPVVYSTFLFFSHVFDYGVVY
jgi:hypothetical protein